MPAVQAGLFAAALAVSALVHAVAYWAIPAVPDPRPAGWAAKRQPVQTVVERVETPEQALERADESAGPERFRPESPEAFASLEPMQREMLESMRDAAAERTAELPAPAEAVAEAPEREADREADAVLAEEAFRQDILQIERRAAEAELEALPRRMAEAVVRVDGAPDVTLPATRGEIAAAAGALEGKGGRGGGLSRAANWGKEETEAAAAAAEPLAVEVLEEIGQHAPEEEELAEAQGALLDERPEEVTDITPIEELLAVGVSRYYAADENAVYFEASISRAGEAGLPVLPKDVLLIQDCSESMTRAKLDFFKAGIREFLATLTTVDRLNMIKYADAPEWCFPEWMPATGANLDETWRFAEKMRARGQTDLFTSLMEALRVEKIPGRPVIAVLMTDGRPTMGTIDSTDIIARFSKANRSGISVFTVGGGERVNSFLLDLLGYNNRGDAMIVPLRDQLPTALRRTARELSRPVLANLSYRFAGGDAAEVYPAQLSHLYLDRPLRLVGRVPAGTKEAVLRIVGDSGRNRHDMVFALDLDGAEPGGEGLRREWAMQKIYKLVNERISGSRREALEEIQRLSDRYNVPLPWSEFPQD